MGVSEPHHLRARPRLSTWAMNDINFDNAKLPPPIQVLEEPAQEEPRDQLRQPGQVHRGQPRRNTLYEPQHVLFQHPPAVLELRQPGYVLQAPRLHPRGQEMGCFHRRSRVSGRFRRRARASSSADDIIASGEVCWSASRDCHQPEERGAKRIIAAFRPLFTSGLRKKLLSPKAVADFLGILDCTSPAPT